MTTGRTIERLVIEVGHKVDGAALDKARAEARAAAEEIRREFDVTADQVKRAAGDIAKENEDAAEKTSEVWTGALRRIGEKVTDFAAGAAGAIASFVADTFEGVRETDVFAQSIGIGTGELIALERGFERVRVPADNTREAVKTLTENLGEMRRVGSGPAVDSLGSLGLKLSDLDGLNTEQTLKVLADRLAGIEDGSKRTSIAIELMGEDGRALLPALLDGASGVDALTQAARDAGQVIDQETIEATRELDAKLAEVKGTAQGVALTVLEKAMPAFSGAADRAGEWIDKNQDFIDQDLPSVFDSIADGISAVVGVLAEAVQLFADAKKAAEDFADALSDFEDSVKIGTATNPLTGEYLSDETVAASQNRVGVRGVGGIVGEKGAAGRARHEEERRFQEQIQRGQDAQLYLIEQRRKQEQAAIAAQRNAAAGEFEGEAKGGKGNKGGKGRGRRPAEAPTLDDDDPIAVEIRKLGEQYEATPKAIEAALASAAGAVGRGASQSVARKRGLGTLGGLVGVDLNKQISRDPLSQLLGIDALPDASPAEMAQERAPQVLTATINNNYAINNQFAINGSDRPDLVPDQVIDRMREVFEDQVNKSGNYSKVVLAR